MAQSKSEFVLTEKGLVYRETKDNEVVNADAIIRNLLATQGSVVKNLMDGVHLRISGTSTYVAERLTQVMLPMIWSPALSEGKPILLPKFGSPTSDDISMTLGWDVPESMHLYFVTWMQPGKTVVVYLVAFRNDDVTKGQFILPLPNTYGDAKICMGRDWDGRSQGNRSLLAYHRVAVDHFFSSPYNLDLSEGKLSTCRAMFTFDGDGTGRYPGKDWHRLCGRCSSNHYDWIMDLVPPSTYVEPLPKKPAKVEAAKPAEPVKVEVKAEDLEDTETPEAAAPSPVAPVPTEAAPSAA